MKKSNGPMIGIGAAGFIIGGLIAFLARPSALLVGQLPFADVISRGASLEGVDQMLVPIAQRSFNLMVVGALIGCIAGLAIGYFIEKRNVV